MSRSKSIGYNGEILVAKFLGLVRTGATGKQIYDLEDKHNHYFDLLKIEVKSGKQIPKLVTSALSQVLPHIKGDQIPAVVMVPKGVGEVKIGDEAIAILRLKDFKKLIDNALSDRGRPISVIVKLDNGETIKLEKD